MSPRRLLAGLAVLALALALAACGSPATDPNVRRGQELLGIGEPEAASRELRIALQRHPDDRQAKALLLVALLRADHSLARWYEAQTLFERLRFLRASSLRSLDGVQRLEQTATRARQALYDKGLATKDADELWTVTAGAAAYSRTAKETDDDERDHAAFAQALHGDPGAAGHLIDRLKSERAAYVPDLLARLPTDVDAPLLALVADRENLGRGRALDTLARLRERQAAVALFGDSGTLGGVRGADLPPTLAAAWRDDEHRGLTRDQALYGMHLHRGGDDGGGWDDDDLDDDDDDAATAADATAAPLRVLWANLDPDGTTRLLIVQGFALDSKQLVTRLYRFDAGRLVALHLDASADSAQQLATQGPLLGVHVDGTALRLLQLGTGLVPVPQEVARASYQPGDRVRVRSLDQPGVVAGTDEFGLLTVTLDQPHRGVRTMSLTAAALRGLETVLQPRLGWRRFDATLTPTALTLAPASTELLPLPSP